MLLTSELPMTSQVSSKSKCSTIRHVWCCRAIQQYQMEIGLQTTLILSETLVSTILSFRQAYSRSGSSKVTRKEKVMLKISGSVGVFLGQISVMNEKNDHRKPVVQNLKIGIMQKFQEMLYKMAIQEIQNIKTRPFLIYLIKITRIFTFKVLKTLSNVILEFRKK